MKRTRNAGKGRRERVGVTAFTEADGENARPTTLELLQHTGARVGDAGRTAVVPRSHETAAQGRCPDL